MHNQGYVHHQTNVETKSRLDSASEIGVRLTEICLRLHPILWRHIRLVYHSQAVMP